MNFTVTFLITSIRRCISIIVHFDSIITVVGGGASRTELVFLILPFHVLVLVYRINKR